MSTKDPGIVTEKYYSNPFIAHLTLSVALAVSPNTAGASTGVPGAWWLPGPFSGGSVVVEMPSTQVFVSLPVAQDVKRRAGGDRR